jgi:hypothetical protein
MTRNQRRTLLSLIAGAMLLVPAVADAQLDPLLFLRRTQTPSATTPAAGAPNVLIAIDTANRMQRDSDNNYRDNKLYPKTGAGFETTLGVTAANTSSQYRRKYVNLVNVDSGASLIDRFTADRIAITGDLDADWATFDAATRINVAKRSIAEAITRNTAAARFGLLRMRQTSPRYDAVASVTGPVNVADASQQSPTDGTATGKWLIFRPLVDSRNGSTATSGLLYKADTNANSSIVSTLNVATGSAGSLVPAGSDAKNSLDAPIDLMLDDLKTEAKRLIDSDADCRNTVAVMIVGGRRGDTSSGDTAAKASQFLSVSNGHRVPIYVILLATSATTDAERTELQSIAANSGGEFTEITPAMQAASPTAPVPELVRAINRAVAHGYAAQSDFDKAPDATHPIGTSTEYQVTSPIVGTVNLEGAKDITGATLPNTTISNPAGVAIPQRSNVMVTSGFSLPGFDGKLRAFRVYRPQADSTKPTGYVFKSDGTRLWVASVPPAASRNIYTALPNGTVVAFTSANAAALQPYLKTASISATQTLIEFIRSQPLGAIVDSTPAIMDAPSLDPPPDSDYPQFANDNKGRRTVVWVGANDGMLHAIDGRLGQEVWAFIPFNLLPKLNELRSGQPVGDFRLFADGSPKIADVKVDGKWRTLMVMGEGPGGTFYQTFDVTLDNMAATVGATSDDISQVLAYFNSTSAVPLKWAFPRYSSFDVSQGTWGELGAAASAVEKTVGQTWSDPAIGQVETGSSRFVVLVGSGFLPYSAQTSYRGGTVAGTTFYVIDAKDGSVLDSRDVGSDGQAEKIDNCVALNDCTKLKNALQADPVATGPADSRFMTKAYLGDLDGRIWRFDVGLDGSGIPKIKQLVSLYTISTGSGSAANHPVFSSMATVNVGGTQQYLFVGTGSDLLPSNGASYSYALLVVLDNGTSGSKTAMITLEKTDGLAGDEKVTSFPAVAGDIVFFSTTTFRSGGCAMPDANLYAFTFIGGPAYDTTGDGRITSSGSSADSTKVRTTTGARATAPFIVDQHLVFSTGSKVEMFGDPQDFNNGVGQAGVRILSWREVR